MEGSIWQQDYKQCPQARKIHDWRRERLRWTRAVTRRFTELFIRLYDRHDHKGNKGFISGARTCMTSFRMLRLVYEDGYGDAGTSLPPAEDGGESHRLRHLGRRYVWRRYNCREPLKMIDIGFGEDCNFTYFSGEIPVIADSIQIQIKGTGAVRLHLLMMQLVSCGSGHNLEIMSPFMNDDTTMNEPSWKNTKV